MSKIKIIMPVPAGGGLVELTKYITKEIFNGERQGGGILGGEYGYGVKYENNTFMMHPYCWCEKEDCKWCNEDRAPNFIYKPTDCQIWWYKWIGRSQEQVGELPKDWLKKCKKSIELQSNKRRI